LRLWKDIQAKQKLHQGREGVNSHAMACRNASSGRKPSKTRLDNSSRPSGTPSRPSKTNGAFSASTTRPCEHSPIRHNESMPSTSCKLNICNCSRPYGNKHSS
jgi:hypothetical protein